VSSNVLEDSEGSDYLEDDHRQSNDPKIDGKSLKIKDETIR